MYRATGKLPVPVLSQALAHTSSAAADPRVCSVEPVRLASGRALSVAADAALRAYLASAAAFMAAGFGDPPFVARLEGHR